MAPAPGDLCTLADVKAVHRTVGDTAAYDQLIEQMILDASAAIGRWSGRRFAPPDAEPSERTFRPQDPYRALVRIADLLEPPVSVSVGTHETDAGATLAGDDYILLPDYRGPYDPITAIRIPNRRWIARVTITGRWGFPQVPPDVRRACVATVSEWLTHAQAGEGPPPEDFTGERGARAIPTQARWLLEPYRRVIRTASVPIVAG